MPLAAPEKRSVGVYCTICPTWNLCALMMCSRPDPRAVARLFAAFVAAG
jgi:hypothetical protein